MKNKDYLRLEDKVEKKPAFFSRIKNNFKKHFEVYFLAVEIPLVIGFGYKATKNVQSIYSTVPAKIQYAIQLEDKLDDIEWKIINPKYKNIDQQIIYLDSLISKRKKLKTKYEKEISKPAVSQMMYTRDSNINNLNLQVLSYFGLIMLTGLTAMVGFWRNSKKDSKKKN